MGKCDSVPSGPGTAGKPVTDFCLRNEVFRILDIHMRDDSAIGLSLCAFKN